MAWFGLKDRTLGVSEGRKYDIPLDQGNGRFFLTLLIAIMVFLAMLSITAAYVLTKFANQWQTGLEGRWTIEIPAVDEQGNLISRPELQKQASELTKKLQNVHAIESVEIMEDDAMLKLLEPWFDLDTSKGSQIDLPIPILISLSITTPGEQTSHTIQSIIENTNPSARLDQHQEWLSNVLRITGSLRLISMFFTLVILTAAITAIAGAIQSRMAEHKDNVQLLHLMGASDLYIMRQFQRHGLIIAFQGGILGLIFGILLLEGIIHYLPNSDQYALPQIGFSTVFWIGLLLLPFMASGLAALTTRFTVLHTLTRMP